MRPPPPEDAAAELAAYRDWLQRSGPARGERGATMLGRTRRVLRSWTEVARNERIPIKTSRATCFDGGCIVTLTAPNAQMLDDVTTSLSLTEAFRTWPGGKWRGVPRVAGKRAEVEWIFFARAPRPAAPDTASASPDPSRTSTQ